MTELDRGTGRQDRAAADEPQPAGQPDGDLWRVVARRAWRRWPVGLAVAVLAAAIGLAATWESPSQYVTRATVFPPSSVATLAAGQRYVADMQAAVNSDAAQREVADQLRLDRSDFGDEIEVRRVRQSSVMDAVMRSPRRLDDAGEALQQLLARAGQSLAAPDVATANALLAQAEEAVSAAEDAAVQAKKARDEFLSDRDGVPPSAELDRLNDQMAVLHLCALGVSVPVEATAEACSAHLAELEPEADTLAAAADEQAAIDRELARTEDHVAEVERERRDAQGAAERAGAGPAVEVSVVAKRTSAAGELARRVLAILVGSVLLGLLVMVGLALIPALAEPGKGGRREEPGGPSPPAEAGEP